MEPSLFRDRPARKTRMTMMVSGAVLIHFSIVGVGAMWQQPVTAPPKDLVTLVFPDPPTDPGVQLLPVANSAPVETPDPSTPMPQVPTYTDVPPTAVVPEMSEPSDNTPPPKPRHASIHATNALSALNSAHGAASASSLSGNNLGVTPGSGRAGTPLWTTPKPPYPSNLRTARLQGTTTVKIVTDASGNVATVVIVRSAGNALLDRYTQNYVREFWKGPANATRTTEFVYQIP